MLHHHVDRQKIWKTAWKKIQSKYLHKNSRRRNSLLLKVVFIRIARDDTLIFCLAILPDISCCFGFWTCSPLSFLMPPIPTIGQNLCSGYFWWPRPLVNPDNLAGGAEKRGSICGFCTSICPKKLNSGPGRNRKTTQIQQTCKTCSRHQQILYSNRSFDGTEQI